MKINKGPREGALYFTQMYYLKNNNSLLPEKKNKLHGIIQNNNKVAYYIEHYNNPITEEKLENTVFEIYYEFDGEEYIASAVCDTLEEALEYADLV